MSEARERRRIQLDVAGQIGDMWYSIEMICGTPMPRDWKLTGVIVQLREDLSGCLYTYTLKPYSHHGESITVYGPEFEHRLYATEGEAWASVEAAIKQTIEVRKSMVKLTKQVATEE